MSDQSKIAYEVGEVYPLNLDDLKPNPEQVRQHFDEASIATLAASIGEDGLLQNITFTYKDDQLYIVSGERRVRALELLRTQGKEVPLYGKYVKGPLRKLAFVENMFREDMTAVEFAESVLALKEDAEKGEEFTQGALGELLGLKRTTVNGIIAITKLPDHLKDKVRKNHNVTRDNLERIARIKGKDRQEKAIDDLLEELAAKEKDKEKGSSKGGSTAGRTRGRMVAENINRFTGYLNTFDNYVAPFSPADRELIATQLTEMQTKISETLTMMSTKKENWDKEYEKKRTPRKNGVKAKKGKSDEKGDK